MPTYRLTAPGQPIELVHADSCRDEGAHRVLRGLLSDPRTSPDAMVAVTKPSSAMPAIISPLAQPLPFAGDRIRTSRQAPCRPAHQAARRPAGRRTGARRRAQSAPPLSVNSAKNPHVYGGELPHSGSTHC